MLTQLQLTYLSIYRYWSSSGFYNIKEESIKAIKTVRGVLINPLNAELNSIYHFLALLGVHHILYLSRIRVNMLQIEHRASDLDLWNDVSNGKWR